MQPSRDDVSEARVFAEPLIPLDEPSAEDTAALARALEVYHAGGNRAALAPFLAYLSTYPTSPWRASLLVNLGIAYRDLHAYTRAMALWEEAWALANARDDISGRAIADLAMSEWLVVAASFGQANVVTARIAALAGRAFRGSAGVRAAHALETAKLILAYPDEVIASGPESLRHLASTQSRLDQGNVTATLARTRPTAAGTSLSEVAALARDIGVPLKLVRRVTAGDVPVPAIVHWKLGHFSPVLERRGDLYRVEDMALGGAFWISGVTLLEESTGAFAVLESASTEGFAAMSSAEAGGRIGHSCVPGGNTHPRPPAPDIPCPGLCGYAFQGETASLMLFDTPLRYTPSRGPAVNFRVVYHHREDSQPQSFSYGNVGPMWNFDWLRFLKEEPAAPACGLPACDLSHVWVHMPGGGRESFLDPNADGTYDLFWRSRAYVVRTSTSPIRYERRLPDGTVEVFSVADGAPAGERRIFMSELIDPQGQSMEFTWDGQRRLVAVTDAIGQVTTLNYDHPTDALKLTSVTDPFSRTATLQYTAEGQLASTTDTIGLVSSYTYGAGDFVSRLTTPYGATTFRHEADWTMSVLTRMVEATDALGETEHMEYHIETTAVPATAPSSEVPTGFETANGNLDHWNTFHWSKDAWRTAPGDVSKATITHWNVAAEMPNRPLRTGTPHSIKRPLEGRVWYSYPGQTDPQVLSWWVEPSKVGRRLDDGSSQIWQWTYDDRGNVLTQTDPVGRRTASPTPATSSICSR